MNISLTQEAHERVAIILKEGDVAIDATCGNGYDTIFLAKVVGETGRVYGFDIQQEAINNTERHIEQENLHNVDLFIACHSEISQWIDQQYLIPIKAIMFNLGYLPGSDKSIITQAETTLKALNSALNIISVNGLITVIVYPGHHGGEIESNAVFSWLNILSCEQYRTEIIGNDLIETAPKLVCIYRI